MFVSRRIYKPLHVAFLGKFSARPQRIIRNSAHKRIRLQPNRETSFYFKYPNPQLIPAMFSLNRHQDVSSAWGDHGTDPCRNTDFTVLSILRRLYPDYHITQTKLEDCDLLGYAQAGHATAVQQDTAYDHSIRSFKAPQNRLAEDAGHIEDNSRFGCWEYQWRGVDFLVYKVVYFAQSGAFSRITLLYVLHSDGPKKRTNDATDSLLFECGKWTRDLHDEIFVFDDVEWKKSNDLWKSIDGTSWDDVILEAGMKNRLINDVQNFFDTRHIYQMSSIPWKRGVIFHGVPGNGKTLSVKALINSLNKRANPIPSLYVKSLDGCRGPKYSIQLIFKQARSMAPCLLVFEDLDSLVTPKTRSYFLNEVDGLSANDGILMIGSTNFLDRLDASITKRPSRFDRKYHFKLPDEQAREAYALYWSRKLQGPNQMFDFPEGLCPIIAKLTAGFSFAFMKELLISSLLTLARGAQAEDFATTEAKTAPPPGGSPTISEGAVLVGSVKDDKEPAGQPADKTSEALPSLDIPEDLAQHATLCAIIAQVTILRKEMETKDGSGNTTSTEEQGFMVPNFYEIMGKIDD